MAYTRLDVDERRRRLLELGTDLFARFSYDELTMARIAREAGISKALLYHYFPGKQAYFSAALEQKASELARLTGTDPALPPLEQLTASLDAFLAWVDDNAVAYGKLVRSAAAIPEVREVVDRVRDATSARILEGIAPGGPPPAALRAAVRAWLWFMDGAILDWVEHGDMAREKLQGLLLGTLLGAVTASGEGGALG
ncbi:MAG TPA: TetR/AcrR family transcriptional regulator [Solirubrobacteraceae bacterium]|nr:TetR/AcrR family transcriptional regulator [Solirubrobacteraceae bacterium]